MDKNINRTDSRTRRPELYTAQTNISAEDQVQALLEALIRLTNPRHTLEVGLATGDTSERLVQALANHGNTIGTYTGVDIKGAAVQAARRRLEPYDVTLVCSDFLDWQPPAGRLFDLVFIDANWKNRYAEYKHTRPMTAPGGLIVMHDTGDASPGRAGALKVAREFGDATLDLACPRGVTVSQVPWKNAK